MRNQDLVLTNTMRDICVGVLLGDASIQTQSHGRTYRIKFQMHNSHMDYALQICESFGHIWIPSSPALLAKRDMIGFQTLTSSSLVPIARLFGYTGIKGQVKGITPNLIQDNLSERGLAYWFMDDGGRGDFTANKGKQIHFHTHGFTLSQVEILCGGLVDKFGLQAKPKPNRGHYVIMISGNSFERFCELVEPYLVPSMRYKLPTPRQRKASP